MNILVFVKQVPDDYVKIRLGADGTPDLEKVEKIVNAFDTYAVEMAVRHCEENGGRVVVATIGQEQTVRPSMVQMIAVGAHQAYIFAPKTAQYDESALAENLKEAVALCEEKEGLSFDLILCGKESTDEISSQVGAMLSQKLSVGFVSAAVAVEKTDETLRIKQETESGYAFYETAAPAVLSVAKPDYDPRYPTLKSKMAARKAQIPYVEGLSEATPAVVCVSFMNPPQRKSGVKIVEKEAADAVAKAMALLASDKVL